MTAGSLARRLNSEIQRLEFLRGSVGILLAWLFACMLLGVLVWGVSLAKIQSDRAEIEKNTFTKAAQLSKAYTEQLSRSIDQIDQITRNLQYDWQTFHGALKLEDQLRQGLYPRSAQIYASIVDSHGTIVTSTLDMANAPNIVDRDYFIFQQLNLDNHLRIEKPGTGGRSGRKVIRFTRRLAKADGTFDGIVVVGVEPAFLAAFTDASSLGTSDSLAIKDMDGDVLAAKMGDRIRSLPSIFRSPQIFESGGGVKRMPGDKFIDGESRIIAWQKLPGYPLVSFVGLSDAAAFAAYQSTADNYRNIAIAGSLLLLLLAAVGISFLSRLAWRKFQVNEVKNTYQLAIDGAHEGFYMVRALYDQQHNVVDFVIKDCNDQGASLVGYAKDELVGKKFSDLYSGAVAQRVLAIFRRAMEVGFYEDEFKPFHNNPQHTIWMSRRLVRSGHGLAMTIRDISETKSHEQALLKMANIEALTALPNRHWLMKFLPNALNQIRNRNGMFAILFIDLDNFKIINDTLGHDAGDELLQEAALRLQSVLRPVDRVVRLGGDEFTLLLDSVSSQEEVAQVAARINRKFSLPFEITEHKKVVSVGTSIGISLFPRDGNDSATLLKNADIAMYSAKAAGKGQFRFYGEQFSEHGIEC
ncbi:diguanylate cyclase/phosphodiesterase (GGDEF & EAL domains) with PAS/PAC sensor [Collimonas arenae]|uniref:Diguanylate cyclase/phosphodiesterase (GGDEF & EAL domains) with PAS/PAC sensor n=1 Tax=Collimonas arenae TaxID=279058 RepID=A0A0A1FF61_9BURK|nr:diguanylate cyclase [Collimonas arenae]AIY42269.1 diguanylate cyclase/phosphodiesterase (GGDEF & EAL domains) with PAS/PAC sensor [Collimonas arenae]